MVHHQNRDMHHYMGATLLISKFNRWGKYINIYYVWLRPKSAKRGLQMLCSFCTMVKYGLYMVINIEYCLKRYVRCCMKHHVWVDQIMWCNTSVRDINHKETPGGSLVSHKRYHLALNCTSSCTTGENWKVANRYPLAVLQQIMVAEIPMSNRGIP